MGRSAHITKRVMVGRGGKCEQETVGALRMSRASGVDRRPHCPEANRRRHGRGRRIGANLITDAVATRMPTPWRGRRTRSWIAPAPIGSDGERLHFRAWSYRHDKWRDYLPVRVSADSSFATEALEAPPARDQQWETPVQIELRQRSDLTAEQQRAVRGIRDRRRWTDHRGQRDARLLCQSTLGPQYGGCPARPSRRLISLGGGGADAEAGGMIHPDHSGRELSHRRCATSRP